MLTKITKYIIKPVSAYKDKTEPLVYLLLFLFPIAGMSIRHWISIIFILLMITALITIRTKSRPLLKEEKIFLWICAFYFLMYIISSTFSGWERPQIRFLERDLRYLAIIPIYLLIRKYPDCINWLFRGALLGGFILVAQVYYDFNFLNLSHANGVYSKNIIGPFAVIISTWLLYYLITNKNQLPVIVRGIIIISISGALLTAALSASRGAYVGFIVTTIFCVVFFLKRKWKITGLIFAVLVSGFFYSQFNTVKSRINTGVAEFTNYWQANDHSKHPSSATSVGVRLEMYRTAFLITEDNLLFGNGPGNYRNIAKKYIADGEIHPAVARHSNPHNAFLEVFISKGLLGLLSLLLLFYYPMYIFIRDYRHNRHSKITTIIGMLHIVAFTAFSLTDHSIVVKNNYIALYLIGISIFLSSHFRSYKNSSD